MFQIEKMEETQILCTQMLVESDPEGEEEVEERQIGWLEVEGSKYRINQGENKIGRDLSCSIVLPKPSLSRIHAIIEVLNHRLIKLTDGTLDTVFKIFKYFVHNNPDAEAKGVTRSQTLSLFSEWTDKFNLRTIRDF